MLQEENPYQSPEEPANWGGVGPTDEWPIDDLPIASAGARFVNYLLDSVCYVLLAMGVGIMTVLVGGEAALDAVDRVPDIVFGSVILLLYYVPQESLMGKTLAKFLTGTKVVAADGSVPPLGAIIGRTFCRMIPFEPFSFFGGNGSPRGWHDRISGTKVVSTR